KALASWRGKTFSRVFLRLADLEGDGVALADVLRFFQVEPATVVEHALLPVEPLYPPHVAITPSP
ncbi:MAG TPA: hypothetical protein VGD78_06820, partial [Chthoniobacterales bacterium]